jgi:NTP pyrophosphatase (non-canonical NTP hydrolase)
MPTIKEVAKEVHEVAKDKGWWDKKRSVGDCIALMHSELSEALEEYRKHGSVYANYNGSDGSKPEGFVVELADCVIRIFDLCELYGLDIEQAIVDKSRYNQTRSYRHGGKAL